MIHIVIPLYNRKELTRECLLALREQSGSEVKIIAVDDASEDGTDKMLSEEFPEVNVIQTPGNFYWTASVNLGIKQALSSGADYIMTMNNDTVVGKDFIANMKHWSAFYPDAILGALEVDMHTKEPHYGGELTNWISNSPRFLLDLIDAEEQSGLHEVSLYPARGLLIPRAVFEKVGLFEEKLLPHYLADYDFTQKARRSGFRLYSNFDAVLYTLPDESGDSENRKQKSLKNYKNHLFGIKGGGNLKNFTIYTLRNCPIAFIPFSLLTGYIRRMVGFWIK